jgi:hypothetical protein
MSEKDGCKGGWKVAASFPSYTCMRYTFISRSDLDSVISNAPGARQAFVMKYDSKVLEASNRVNAKRRDKTVDDIYMELWEHVFERDCRVLQGFRKKAAWRLICAPALATKPWTLLLELPDMQNIVQMK